MITLLLIVVIATLASTLVFSYTPPSYSSVNFTLGGTYTTPNYQSLNFTLGDEAEGAGAVLNCTPTLNEDWEITSALNCTDSHINLGNGRILLGHMLTLNNCNVSAAGYNITNTTVQDYLKINFTGYDWWFNTTGG